MNDATENLIFEQTWDDLYFIKFQCSLTNLMILMSIQLLVEEVMSLKKTGARLR